VCCSPDPQCKNIEQIISLFPPSLAADGASPPGAVPPDGDATSPATQPPQEQLQQRRARRMSSSPVLAKAAAPRRLGCCGVERAWPSFQAPEALVCCTNAAVTIQRAVRHIIAVRAWQRARAEVRPAVRRGGF